MTIDRSYQIETFLTEAGWGDTTQEPLTGDASSRSYRRVYDADSNRVAMLMDAPKSAGENILPFLKISAHLSAHEFSAPKILAHDEALGFILLEDLGDALYSWICGCHSTVETELYSTAVDALSELHNCPLPDGVGPYGDAVYETEAALLTEWYLPAATGKQTEEVDVKDFADLISAACGKLNTPSPVLVLRDFHAENLIWLPDRKDTKRVGLLDFQDALIGHPAYDLVSLLEDARRDTSDVLQQEMFDRFAQRSDINRDDLRLAYATLGAQRNLKIIGIFTRLCLRDGKFSYLDLIPRVWAHLQKDLAHPDLSELEKWIQQNVPEPTDVVINKIRWQMNAS